MSALLLPLRPRGLALPEDLRGLTLHALWVQAITVLGKDVENRRWRHIPRAHVGQLVALHAGATVVEHPLGVDLLQRCARRAGWVVQGDHYTRDGREVRLVPSEVPTRAIVGLVRIARARRDSPSPWAMDGSVHLELADLVVLPTPIPCPGMLGWWRVPPAVRVQIKEVLGG